MDLTPGMMVLYTVAASEAVFIKSVELEPEHFLLGVLKLDDVVRRNSFPQDLSPDDQPAAIREISEMTELMNSQNVRVKEMRRRLRFLAAESQKEKGEFNGHRSQRGRDLFESAEKTAEEHNMKSLGLLVLLSAILKTESAPIDSLFQEYTVDRSQLLSTVESTFEKSVPDWLKQLSGDGEAAKPPTEEGGSGPSEAEKSAGSEPHPLAKLGRDLTYLAREGKLGPIIGRQEEIKTIARILTQRTRNNPLLLGDPGVGKTAVVEGLALYAASQEAIQPLKGMCFVEITMSALVAGTKYRGEFEERLQKVLETAHDEANLVLFIDEIHTILGAGAGEGSLDAANILKPALARGDIRCIGATTTSEYRKHFEPDGALSRRFQTVWIDEPSYDDTLQILHGLRPKLEAHHELKIPDEALEKAVSLSTRYLPEGYQPDKAIMVLDEACARRRLQTLHVKPGTALASSIEVADIGEVVARRSHIPPEVILKRDEERLLSLDDELRKRVIGQEQAVAVAARAIRIARAGLKSKNRPVVLFFAGPTGTGKTELAKAISQALFFSEDRLVALDMSEYQESHAVAKIIGSPPGYVGYGEESLFVREIRQYPYSVILLDEIEKAHPDILTIFLQVFDEGRLTDARGRKINCAEAVFIMTSNLGATLKIKPAIGFQAAQKDIEALQQKKEAQGGQIRQAVIASLRPELVNRIQEIVIFNPLTIQAIRQIVDLFVQSTNNRLLERKINLCLDDSAKDLLAQAGYSEDYGARYLNRAFERLIADPLSREILSGNIQAGQTALFRRDGDELALDIEEEIGLKTLHFPGSMPPGEL